MRRECGTSCLAYTSLRCRELSTICFFLMSRTFCWSYVDSWQDCAGGPDLLGHDPGPVDLEPEQKGAPVFLETLSAISAKPQRFSDSRFCSQNLTKPLKPEPRIRLPILDHQPSHHLPQRRPMLEPVPRASTHQPNAILPRVPIHHEVSIGSLLVLAHSAFDQRRALHPRKP